VGLVTLSGRRSLEPVDPQFESLLAYLKEARGFDFTGYKRSSLMRRVNRRMAQIGLAEDYQAYSDYLQVHPDEFTFLFNTILINVTGFFRDPDAWTYLREEVVEPLLATRPVGAIRIWSAGCASGEEAYTLAMMLAEVLGIEAFRSRVKIYATDVDAEQLSEARQAVYDERAMRSVPTDLVERYFEPVGDKWVFHKDLRRSVIFGRNDLVQDAPISRIDLLLCRNTLMYFNAETQAKILNRFHFALADGGILFLGKAEMLLSHGNLFLPVELKQRIFRRVSRQLPPLGPLSSEAAGVGGPSVPGFDSLRNEAFAASPTAQLVLTSGGQVALTNRQLDLTFGTSSRDIGRPFRDLDLSFRPVELRKYVEQAQLERRSLRIPDIEYLRAPGEMLHLEVQVNPLIGSDDGLLGVSLIFQDVTTTRRLHEELEHTNQQLEAAYEELQSTNEELETTNEELQSTVEELETTNEELQSTNEELETMNEELQSTNDELQSINDQLQASTNLLDDANTFLETVLAGLRAGVVVVDSELRVRAWNGRAEDLWGLRAAEVIGQHFLNLDIGLPAEDIRPLLRSASAPDGSPGEITLRAINRRGRTIVVRVACTPLRNQHDGRVRDGAIVVMESDEAQ
jgi:two-component system CheB/CheR fusion protein